MDEALDIEVVSNADGVCELRLVATPEAVQAIFDRVFSQAVETAQQDTGLRVAAGIPPWQPVPDETVLAQYRPSIIQSVQTSLVDWCVATAAETLDLLFVDTPVTRVESIEQGKPVTLEMSCFMVPQIPASALDGLRLERRQVVVDDAMLDRAVEEVRRTAAETTRADRPAALGDRIELDVESKRAGVQLPAGTFTHGLFDLLDDSPVAAIAAQLVGASAGDVVSFQLHGPEGDSEPVAVRARVRAIGSVELPPVDDALVQKLGAESVEDLRRRLRANLEERYLLADEGRILSEVAEHVAGRVAIPVPELLAKRRFAAQLKGVLHDQISAGVAPNLPTELDIEALWQRAKPEAEAQARAALVLLGLARSLGIRVKTPELRTWITNEVARLGLPRDLASQIVQDRVRWENMRLCLVRTRLVERLLR